MAPKPVRPFSSESDWLFSVGLACICGKSLSGSACLGVYDFQVRREPERQTGRCRAAVSVCESGGTSLGNLRAAALRTRHFDLPSASAASVMPIATHIVACSQEHAAAFLAEDTPFLVSLGGFSDLFRLLADLRIDTGRLMAGRPSRGVLRS